MIDYSIIIDCPDSYLDILRVFFIFLDRNWKTRTHKIFITSQNEEIEHPTNVEFVKCGQGLNSIQRSKKALELIDTNYVLFIDCDDFIGKPILNSNIDNMLEYASINEIKYIRVWKTKNREHRKYKTEYKKLYFCNRRARYSKSLMANFWQKQEYLEVFKSDEADGWSVEGEWLKQTHFENKGYYDSYCYFDVDPFHIVHAVSKGKWIKKAYKFAQHNGISKDLLSSREKLPFKISFKQSISTFLMNHFPSSFCYRLKRVFGKKVDFTSNY